MSELLDQLMSTFNMEPIGLQVGLGCLAAQCVLWVLFSYVLPNGPWRSEPGFTAHQVVCVALMPLFAYLGTRAWFFEPRPTTALGRVLGPHDTGALLTQLVIGELLLWDTPTGLCVSSLREPVMLLHHVGMLLCAVIGTTAYSYYGCCFFGLVEISGIPLIIVDLFHPKHRDWHRAAEESPLLNVINDAARAAFALAFLLVRGIYFGYIVFAQVLPDAWAVYSMSEKERGNAATFAVVFIPTCGVLFSLLQWYWATLVIKQLIKAFKHKPKDKKAI